MNITQFPALMAFVSAGMMVYSILLAVKIFTRLPLGGIRNWWKLLVIFIAGLAICCIVFLLAASQRETDPLLLAVAAAFFCSAVFVLLTLQLFTHTLTSLESPGLPAGKDNIDDTGGIYNLRFFEIRLHEEFERARRYNIPLSVLLIEIDNFQKATSSYGRSMSDKAFTEICGLIKGVARGSDILARYGGDQLVMLLPHTALYSAMKAAEKYRSRIEGKVLDMKDVKDAVISVRLTYTVSIGVATLHKDVKKAGELTRRADIALYKAKNQGRNQVVLYGEIQHGSTDDM